MTHWDRPGAVVDFIVETWPPTPRPAHWVAPEGGGKAKTKSKLVHAAYWQWAILCSYLKCDAFDRLNKKQSGSENHTKEQIKNQKLQREQETEK